MARASKMNRQKSTKDQITTNLGTDKNDIVKILDEPITIDGNTFDCVAKDDKGMYLTKTSIVNSCLLDSFKQYKRIHPPQDIIIEDIPEVEESSE